MDRVRTTRLGVVIGAVALLVLVLLLSSQFGGDDPPTAAPPAPSDASPDTHGEVAADGGDGLPPSPVVEPGEAGPTTGKGVGVSPPDPPEGRAGREGAESKPGSSAKPGNSAKPPGYFPHLTGRVVDVTTGKPIANARVLYGPFPGWWGHDTRKDGSFRFHIVREHQRVDVPYRVRVSAPGRETLEFIPDEPEFTVEMRRSGGSALPGRIQGRAEDRDGRTLEGVLWIVLGSETARLHWLYVLVDVRGEFVLDGVPPGPWRIGLLKGGMESVYVPGNGDAHVTLRASRTREELLKARTPRTTEAELGALENRLAAMRVSLAFMLDSDEREELVAMMHSRVRRLEDEINRLKRPREGERSRREVRVTGLDGRDGQVLVAEFYAASTERWWATVRKGKAKYPALRAGSWTFTLLDPTGKRVRFTKNIPDGSGTAVVEFSR